MTEHAAAHATLGDLLWPALNFAIFVAVLVRFLRPPAVEYFRARAARLREALQAGGRAPPRGGGARGPPPRGGGESPAPRPPPARALGGPPGPRRQGAPP